MTPSDKARYKRLAAASDNGDLSKVARQLFERWAARMEKKEKVNERD